MDLQELKQSIKDKELRLSQLRSMDTNKLEAHDRKLMENLEKEIEQLKDRLNEE